MIDGVVIIKVSVPAYALSNNVCPRISLNYSSPILLSGLYIHMYRITAIILFYYIRDKSRRLLLYYME